MFEYHELRDIFERWVHEQEEALTDVERPLWLENTEEGLCEWYRHVVPVCVNELEKDKDVERHSCSTLFLIVGTSLQPLLFSIRWFAPHRVVLFYTDEDDDAVGRESLETLHAVLRSVEPSCTWESQKISTTDSIDIFLKIRDSRLKLDEEIRDRVVLDITGGKKSMVSSAFLVGIEYDMKLSYIDSLFDVHLRMPNPLSMKPMIVQNPVQVLALSNARSFHEHMKSNSFARAVEDMEHIEKHMENQPLLATQRLCDFDVPKAKICCTAMNYHSNREYEKAIAEFAKLPDIQECVPQFWRDIAKKKQGFTSIYHCTRTLFLYLCDRFYWLHNVSSPLGEGERFLQTYVLAELAINWFFYQVSKQKKIVAHHEKVNPSGDLLFVSHPGKISLLTDKILEYPILIPKKDHFIMCKFTYEEATCWKVYAQWYNEHKKLRNALAHGKGVATEEDIQSLVAMVRDVLVDAARKNPKEESVDFGFGPEQEWWKRIEEFLDRKGYMPEFQIQNLPNVYAR